MSKGTTKYIPAADVSAIYRAHRAAVKLAMKYAMATPGTQTIRRLEDRVHRAELRFDRSMMRFIRNS